MSARPGLALALLVATASGCLVEQVDHTLVTVHLEAPRVSDQPHRVRVRVYRGRFEGPPVRDCFVELASADTVGMVTSVDVPVQPTDNDAPTEFSIEAELFVGPEVVAAAWQRAIVAYVPDRQVEITLRLSSRCAGLACRNDQSCVDDACVSACWTATEGEDLARGPCAGAPGAMDGCLRAPAQVHGVPASDGSLPSGESFCGGDGGVCYCDDPPGCIPSAGAAACCRTRPLCEPMAACRWARQRLDGGCPDDLVPCPTGGRCVGARTVEACCGPGTTACFGS